MNPSVLWYKVGSKVSQLPFTATLEENHQGQATISKYPVQSGFIVSDHMIRQNKIINVKAIIPNTTLGGVNAEGASVGASIGNLVGLGGAGAVIGGIAADPIGVATDYIQGVSNATEAFLSPVAGAIDTVSKWVGVDTNVEGVIDEFLADPSRIQAAFQTVEKIQNEGIICTLSTILKEYDNLVLISYNIPTNIEFSNAIYLDLVFEQVRLVDRLGRDVGRISPEIPSPTEQENVLEQVKQIGGKAIDTATDLATGIWGQFA